MPSLLSEDFSAVLTAAGLLPILTVTEQGARIQRERRAVERLVRGLGFRLRGLPACSWRWAVTGWSARPSLSQALLDAAHWAAVKDGGSDGIKNGLALTPTVHRLLDTGMLGFASQGGLRRLQRYQTLDDFKLDGPGGRLQLMHGQPPVLPPGQWL